MRESQSGKSLLVSCRTQTDTYTHTHTHTHTDSCTYIWLHNRHAYSRTKREETREKKGPVKRKLGSFLLLSLHTHITHTSHTHHTHARTLRTSDTHSNTHTHTRTEFHPALFPASSPRRTRCAPTPSSALFTSLGSPAADENLLPALRFPLFHAPPPLPSGARLCALSSPRDTAEHFDSPSLLPPRRTTST